LSGLAVPEQDVFPYHAESHGRLQAPAERVFAHLDDHTRLSAHMSRRSWRMGWGRLHLHLDERAGRAVGSRIRLDGLVFGVWLFGHWYARWCTQRMLADAEAAFAPAAPAAAV
jgi:hypothetical protein